LRIEFRASTREGGVFDPPTQERKGVRVKRCPTARVSLKVGCTAGNQGEGHGDSYGYHISVNGLEGKGGAKRKQFTLGDSEMRYAGGRTFRDFPPSERDFRGHKCYAASGLGYFCFLLGGKKEISEGKKKVGE